MRKQQRRTPIERDSLATSNNQRKSNLNLPINHHSSGYCKNFCLKCDAHTRCRSVRHANILKWWNRSHSIGLGLLKFSTLHFFPLASSGSLGWPVPPGNWMACHNLSGRWLLTFLVSTTGRNELMFVIAYTDSVWSALLQPGIFIAFRSSNLHRLVRGRFGQPLQLKMSLKCCTFLRFCMQRDEDEFIWNFECALYSILAIR